MSSKLKFIEPIVEAIAKLAERNGSSAKDILNYIWRSDKGTVKRNLTLQVRKALKQAVMQGRIRLCGGRYKAPTSSPIKKVVRAVDKEKNCLQPAVQPRKQTRRGKVGKGPKKLTKGSLPESKSHATPKPRKAKKRPKPPAK